jgi:putative flippase GtrA
VRISLSSHARLVAKYVVVGGANTLLFSATLFIFLDSLHLVSTVAVAMAYAVAMVFQFIANRVFTFRSKASAGPQIVKYLGMSGITYVLNVLVIEGARGMELSNLVAVVACASVTAVVGYVLGYFWVYR